MGCGQRWWCHGGGFMEMAGAVLFLWDRKRWVRFVTWGGNSYETREGRTGCGGGRPWQPWRCMGEDDK